MTLLMTSGALKISSMFHYRTQIITKKGFFATMHGATGNSLPCDVRNTESLGLFNVRSMTLFKSNAQHSQKTAFSVIVYSLNLKYFSVPLMIMWTFYLVIRYHLLCKYFIS